MVLRNNTTRLAREKREQRFLPVFHGVWIDSGILLSLHAVKYQFPCTEILHVKRPDRSDIPRFLTFRGTWKEKWPTS
jgi:hypothetical protein